ncbi:MAG: calcium:proton antiporter [Planctomycetaceae bacterium]|nr:calcium:proton antiporter [Planctomycetaceae bacterium]|tara:strand:+ start:26463 stop:27596 length:1134 start_codon:yes stop_codon:yes gene_type:complete
MNLTRQRHHVLTWQNGWILTISYPMMLVFIFLGDAWNPAQQNVYALATVFVGLFLVMLASSFIVVRHAEKLAEYLGEPYGTLILTLSVVGIEVAVITSVMVHGENNPTLARDTIFAVVMIVLNGVVGLSLLVGGIRHFEQSYNLRGANAYLGVLIPLSLLGLVLPRVADSAIGGYLSTTLTIYLIFSTTLLYLIFLAIQTTRHRDLFRPNDGSQMEDADLKSRGPMDCLWYGLLLLLTMIPIVALSEPLAQIVDRTLEESHLPAALGGVLVATLVLSAEGITALKAARSDSLTRSINISLGAALSTIGMTIPCVLALATMLDTPIVLGLNWVDAFLLGLTLMVTVVTFGSGRTGVLQGAVHLLLFATYIVSIFDAAP